MNRSDWFNPKWQWLKRFALAGAAGLVIVISGIAMNLLVLTALGAMFVIPLIFWLAFIPVLHWKDRYIGQNNGVWGGFLAFETSGCSKIIYWFRHVLPDWRRSGRYVDAL